MTAQNTLAAEFTDRSAYTMKRDTLYISIIEQFRNALQSAGLIAPDEIETDGALHRFASNGKRGDLSGWYVLHSDGIPAGRFGDWRSGLSQTWCADIGRELSAKEKAAHRDKVEAMRRERKAEEMRRHDDARQKSQETWWRAGAVLDHPYLKRKGVKGYGLRMLDKSLIVPLRDTGAIMHSLQIIGQDGRKLFLSGGRIKGCYFGIGKPNGVLCIAEGYATGASIHEATGYAVAVGFYAGNLLHVANAIRSRFPDTHIIVCADDDYLTAGNPGLTKARVAAHAVGGIVAVPDFGHDRPQGATDFNDLHRARGLEAVSAVIAEYRSYSDQRSSSGSKSAS